MRTGIISQISVNTHFGTELAATKWQGFYPLPSFCPKWGNNNENPPDAER